MAEASARADAAPPAGDARFLGSEFFATPFFGVTDGGAKAYGDSARIYRQEPRSLAFLAMNSVRSAANQSTQPIWKE
jgi:hypothetical protein